MEIYTEELDDIQDAGVETVDSMIHNSDFVQNLASQSFWLLLSKFLFLLFILATAVLVITVWTCIKNIYEIRSIKSLRIKQYEDRKKKRIK